MHILPHITPQIEMRSACWFVLREITTDRDWYAIDKSISNWRARAIDFDKPFQSSGKCANVHYLKWCWPSTLKCWKLKHHCCYLYWSLQKSTRNKRGMCMPGQLSPSAEKPLHQKPYQGIDHPFQTHGAPPLLSGRCYTNYPKQVHKMGTFFCQNTDLNLHRAQFNEVYLQVFAAMHSWVCNWGKNRARVRYFLQILFIYGKVQYYAII